MLEVTINQANEFGLGQWSLMAAAYEAPPELKSQLQDNTLLSAKSASLRQLNVSTAEPLLINGRAFLVLLCLRGKQCGLWLQLNPLLLLREHLWGSEWELSHEDSLLYQPKTCHEVNKPVWWRRLENRFTLLH
eukprot:Skav228207  [mRNA]  locus=scaffold3579:18314:18712:+ [translate_table: standard]